MHPNDDEEVVRALMRVLQADVFAVLARHRTALTEEGTPRTGRFLEMAAMVEVLGALLREAIDADPERARPWATETIARLELFVSAGPSDRAH